MLRPLLLLSLLNLSHAVLAQQPKADSIEQILRGDLSPHDRAMKMISLAMYYEVVDAKKSIALYDAARNFAVKNNQSAEAAMALQNKSFILSATGDYKGVIKALDTALEFAARADTLKRDTLLPRIYQSMANGYQYCNDLKSASSYMIKAVAGYEKLKMYRPLIHCYFNISSYFKQMHEWEKQLEWGEKTLVTAGEWGGKEGFFAGWSIKAYAHTMMNEYETAHKERDSAWQYYEEGYSFQERISYFLISGLINMNVKELEKARSDFEKSLSIAEENRNLFSITQSRLQLARVLTMEKKFGEAEKALRLAEMQIAQSRENEQKLILLDYYGLLYEEWGKYRQALDYFKQQRQLSDSITSLDNKKFISEIETRYGSEKKEAEIRIQKALVRQKEFINYLLIASVAIIFLTALLVFRAYRQKQYIQRRRISELETEKQLTATESVLKGEEQERIRLAKDLHDGLGGMLSGIKYSLKNMKGNLIMTPDNAQAFERSMDMLDSSIREMRRVAHNMMPDTLIRSGLDSALRDFCNEINQMGVLLVNYQSIGLENEQLDQTAAITIYRIVQELINNVIKHASANTAIVQISKIGQQVSVTVEDDGKGFDSDIAERKVGMGLSNIRNRVEFLKGKMDIRTQAGKGTSILIEFAL